MNDTVENAFEVETANIAIGSAIRVFAGWFRTTKKKIFFFELVLGETSKKIFFVPDENNQNELKEQTRPNPIKSGLLRPSAFQNNSSSEAAAASSSSTSTSTSSSSTTTYEKWVCFDQWTELWILNFEIISTQCFENGFVDRCCVDKLIVQSILKHKHRRRSTIEGENIDERECSRFSQQHGSAVFIGEKWHAKIKSIYNQVHDSNSRKFGLRIRTKCSGTCNRGEFVFVVVVVVVIQFTFNVPP